MKNELAARPEVARAMTIDGFVPADQGPKLERIRAAETALHRALNPPSLKPAPSDDETVAALREASAKRHEPKSAEDAGLFFITKYGLAWNKDTSTNPVSQEIGKLLRSLGINGRKGLGFYTLRHTFRTIADESKDQPAVDFIMGHEVPHMSSVYRETISD